MKKRILSLALALVLLFACGCQKQSANNNSNPEELFNYEVTHEPFEDMEICYSCIDYLTCDSEAELFEASDMVFIGMPTETFTDGEGIPFNVRGERIPEGSDEGIAFAFTVRNVKVLKMLKGDDSVKEVKVGEDAFKQINSDGSVRITELPYNHSIAKKNAKYIYYVDKTIQKNMDFYTINIDRGLVNIDGLDVKTNYTVGNTRLNEVKTRFAAEFEKYDRSSELAAK